jgi:hypothetical protein
MLKIASPLSVASGKPSPGQPLDTEAHSWDRLMMLENGFTNSIDLKPLSVQR